VRRFIVVVLAASVLAIACSDAVVEPPPVGGVDAAADVGVVFDAEVERDAAALDASPREAGSDAAPLDPVNAAAIRAKLNCTQISARKFPTDEGLAATVAVCKKGSAIYFTADLDVDCDGISSAVCSKATDPTFQAQTAATTSTGAYMDAAKMPYVVVPGVSVRWNYLSAGVSMGTAALVVYKDKIVYATVGDVGPVAAIGEASYAAAKALDINPNPKSGGTDSGVTYILFPGAANDIAKPEDQALVERRVRALALAWLAE
jgi:Fungal chitosanase of glycosyl hydrolase group 75